MDTFQITVIIVYTIIFTLIATYLISRVVIRIKKKIKHYNSLWSTLHNLKQDTADMEADITDIQNLKIANRLRDVEKIANNFDRDMNNYNHCITRDNVSFTSKYNEVIGKFKKGLRNAFRRITKLEEFNEDLGMWHERLKKVEDITDKLEKAGK